MDDLWIKVEIRPGTHISSASKQIIRLATILDRDIEFKFNERRLIGKPRQNPDELVMEFNSKQGGD